MGNEVIKVKDLTHVYYRYVVDTSSLRARLSSILARRREEITALSNINLSIEYGERIALLGPNGAGKSTLIKIILGVIKPAKGRVLVFGTDPYRNRRTVSRHYGVVFGNRDLLWWHIPVIDSLRILRKVYGIREEEFNYRLELYGGILCTERLLQTPPQKMSLGQRRRCEFLASLIHSPRLLVLDEPFLGLDIFVRESIRGILKKFHGEDRGTIIMSTHELSEIPEDYRVVLLDRGRIVYDGGVEELRARVKPVRYVKITVESRQGGLVIEAGEVVEVVEADGVRTYKLVVSYDGLNPLLASLDYSRVLDIQIESPGLEELMKELVGGSQDDRE